MLHRLNELNERLERNKGNFEGLVNLQNDFYMSYDLSDEEARLFYESIQFEIECCGVLV